MISRLSRLAVFMLVLCGAVNQGWSGLPDPAKGGKNGGPVDLLIIRGRSSWAFGTQPELDEKYQAMLKERGYRVTSIFEWSALNTNYLNQFNTVVYLNPSEYLGGGYFDHTAWWGGYHMLTVRSNTAVLRQWVQDGGGLLIAPAFEQACMRMTESLNDLFKPYGLATTCACVRDAERAWSVGKVGASSVDYPWTERLTAHPVTEGVKRIWYPAYCTRWDDNYMTIPLRPLDKAWTVVAQAMPGSRSEMRRSPVYDDKGDWTPVEGWDEPAIFMAREFGKGRLAVTGLSAWHLFYITYAKIGDVTESAFSRVDGICMTEGDGKTKSDLHLLLDNTYRWLAEPSLKAGMGGYDAAKGIALAPVDHSKDQTFLSGVWADKDPMVTGPVRPMKILVGARGAISSGKGSVADWAGAAKKAGYDVICFTEPFEHFKVGQWDAYVADCVKYSDEQVTLLPGLDIDSDLGNRFLLVGLYQAVRTHLLTPDQKKLFWTGHMMLGMGDILPIAARPQWLASVRGAQGALPPDLYSHVAGIPIATYEGTEQKQVDDGLFAYQWHVYNSTMPIPLAVHEVSAPDQLEAAAKTGLQNYVNSDTPEHGAFYFRQGFANYGGNPARYYVSSGPIVDACSIDNWQAPAWNISLKAHGAQPISEVLVHDRRGVYRRLTPNATNVEVQLSGDLSVQHWFMVELRDVKGGKGYLSPIRTLTQYVFARCQDRQNFFGERFPWLSYVGKMPQSSVQPGVPGVKLEESICCKPQMLYAGYLHTILDYVLDSTYVPAGELYDYEKKVWSKGGRQMRYDNAPVFNEMPMSEYAAKIRSIHYRSRTDTRNVSPPAFVEEWADIRLKMDLKATGEVWPVIGNTAAKANYGYIGKDGKKVTGTVEKFVDLPAGGWAGDIVALSPLRVGAGGAIGFPPPPDGNAKAGTAYRGGFMKVETNNLAAVLNSMGLDGPTPYTLTMKQGKLNRVMAAIHFDAEDGGAAGHLKGAAVPAWGPKGWKSINPGYEVGVPLRLHGANPCWPAGLWTTRDDKIEPFGFLDGVAFGIMLVDTDADFYFGNLLTASDANLNLAFGAEWTKDRAVIEVNNPTDKAITATVRTAGAIPGRKAFEQKVTVPAGSTIYVEAK